MATFTEIKGELKYKEKKINDLIRFIENRTDNNPNYSLLLGAGCSITSGVKTATRLIDIWKKDIYLENYDDEEYDETKAELYFNQCVWYDSRNPYSSLFEKKYDLPRQRRVFVEKEVGDKSPSIGYTYLTKLVENDYFKTIFTTNFDDLINEAFYQYSSIRPILCAHDSAISSITITSKRPKVIKLHGDYLFDDIKSTLRETESLEDNIKNKFIEFAKDYGLIVLGYAGNDRSIVDILTHLLKNEDYFKHGIYWCLRNDSEINEDLRKLLWKERVFFVEIDGFDELMAEMHSKLNKNSLPLDNSLLNERKDNLIKKLISNKFLKETENKYIKKDMLKLKQTLESDVISSFFKYLGNKDNNTNKRDNTTALKEKRISSQKGSKTLKSLLEIQEAIFTKNYKEALRIIDDKYKNIDKDDLNYIKIIELKAKCYRKLDNNKKAIECYKILVINDKLNIQNYTYLSDLADDLTDKLKYLEDAIKIDPYFDSLHFYKSSIMFEFYENALDKNNIGFTYQEIEKVIDQSIQVNPSINNPAYNLKFKILDKVNNPEKANKEKKSLLVQLEKQDRFHPIVIGRYIDIAIENGESDSILSFFEERRRECQHKEYDNFFEMCELELYARLVQPLNTKQKMDYIESEYEIGVDYLEKKAEIQLDLLNDIQGSIKTLESISMKSKRNYTQLIERYLYLNDIDNAEKIYKSHLSEDKRIYISILEAKKDYNGAFIAVNELLQDRPNDNSLYILKSYILLKLGNYDEAYSFTKDSLELSSFSDPHLLINYYISLKKKKKLKFDKVNDKILKNIKVSDIVKAAGYALIDDFDKSIELLNDVCNKENSLRYVIKNWVVFEELSKTDRFSKIVN